jgi:hypothetical protein
MSELTVDFTDPESIAAAVPRAETLIHAAEKLVLKAAAEAAQARERAGRAEVDVQRWQTLLMTLERMSESYDNDRSGTLPTRDSDGEAPESSKERALIVITAINGPTNIAEVAEHMPQFSRKTVSWALWKLADEGAIQKLGHGRYAPVGYSPGQVTTNYFDAAKFNFPAPDVSQVAAVNLGLATIAADTREAVLAAADIGKLKRTQR